MEKSKKQVKKRVKLTGDDRIVDLLERIGVANLYLNANLGENDIADILKMGDNRVSEILKGVKKKKITIHK